MPITIGVLTGFKTQQELPCKRFDVGVLLDESTACAMRTFHRDAAPKMAVDVRSKALLAYFSATVHEARPFTLGSPEISPSTFRLKIPFPQLVRVWETYHANSHEVSLTIILDSPPVYHRQSTDIQATFSTESSWRETDLWMRQTSIAHNLGSQDQARVSLRKSGQIVDLGMFDPTDFLIWVANH
jgi:hypothetical protein